MIKILSPSNWGQICKSKKEALEFSTWTERIWAFWVNSGGRSQLVKRILQPFYFWINMGLEEEIVGGNRKIVITF